MAEGERIAALLAVREFPSEEGQQFVVMGTRRGVVKKTALSAFSNPRAGGIIAMGIDENDAAVAEALDDGPVVNDFVKDVNRRTVAAQRSFHRLYSHFYASAESTRLRYDDFSYCHEYVSSLEDW